jgi:hypothetical protein
MHISILGYGLVVDYYAFGCVGIARAQGVTAICRKLNLAIGVSNKNTYSFVRHRAR